MAQLMPGNCAVEKKEITPNTTHIVVVSGDSKKVGTVMTTLS